MEHTLKDGLEFVDKIAREGKCSKGVVKSIKSVCKLSSPNSLAIIGRVVQKLKKSTKIESKLALFELLDILFLRSNACINIVYEVTSFSVCECPISQLFAYYISGTNVSHQGFVCMDFLL